MKGLIRHVVFACCLFHFYLSSNPAISQPEDLFFQHISVEQGLSHGSVMSIYQDHKGFMWFGTTYGLSQYDGNKFNVYLNDPSDSTTIDHNSITYITEDSKNRLWIGTKESLNLLDWDRNKFIHFRNKKYNIRSIAEGTVICVIEDSEGTMWVTTTGMLHEFDPESGSFVRYIPREEDGQIIGEIGAIFEDSRHNLWVGTENGIRLFDRKRKVFLNPLHDFQIKADEQVPFHISFTEDSRRDLWVGNRGTGLRKYSFAEKKWTHYVHDVHDGRSLASDYVNGILEDAEGGIWISTGREGLIFFDFEREVFYPVSQVSSEENGMNTKTLNTIYADRSGGIWIGTWHGGINFLIKDFHKIIHYKKVRGKNSLSSNLVNAIVGDKSGGLWIGTEDGGGLNYFSMNEKQFFHYESPDVKDEAHTGSSNIKALLYSRDGKVWVGTVGGLEVLDPEDNSWKYYRNEGMDTGSISAGFVISLLEDSRGNIWAGLRGGGLNQWNPRTEKFSRYSYSQVTEDSYETILSLYEDKAGLIWVGTADSGLKILDPTTNRYASPNFDIPDKTINSIFEDQSGLIWLCTGGGGVKSYNMLTEEVKIYNRKDGLPSNFIYGIVEDEQGRLWLSSNNGISCLDRSGIVIRNYNSGDGLQSNLFLRNAFYKTATGQIVAGGINGFNIFRPSDLNNNSVPPPVEIIDFQLFNKSVGIGTKDSPLKKHIRNTTFITLTHRQSVFSFEFSALNFNTPEKNQYAYIMENYDMEWNMVGTRRFASYTNLPAGEYTFRVKAANNDNVWNEEGDSIHITILPRPWLTWWAYMIYGILLLGIIYLIRSHELARIMVKNELELEKLNHQKDEEIHQLKMDFFTNISHELRSPLTLILSPLETLLSHPDQSPFVVKQYQFMERNVKHLLRLINQLLDFRKVELGMMKLKVSQGDFAKFVFENFQVFKALAEQKNIEYQFETQDVLCLAWFDWDKMEKVLFNILSNAIKFTPKGGTIKVEVGKENKIGTVPGNPLKLVNYYTIRVSDNGPGIKSDKLQLIFERFYQVSGADKTMDKGFGIGLAFAKELLEMHHGFIHVESEENRGSIFTIYLPTGKEHFLPHEIVTYSEHGKGELTNIHNDGTLLEKSISIPLLLIADDDTDIRAYLKDSLKESYRIIEAENGREAWHLVQNNAPDLIISDVLMPEMDGVEFCHMLKTEMHFCHIPVILLTALSSVEHRIKGIDAGADSYIPKPFNLPLLIATVSNLLESRKLLRQVSKGPILLSPKDYSPTTLDKTFLEDLIDIIDDHIEDVDFDMSALQIKVGMSQSSLYRKLKSLTDQSGNEFIRNIRLDRAAEMIAQTDMNIAGVAYKVGFSDPKYFSTCFRKRYGISPSNYKINVTELSVKS